MKKLKVHGGNANMGKLSPKLKEVKDILDAAKEHEAFTSKELCARANVNMFFLRQRGFMLDEYRFSPKGNMYLYASLKTVKNHKGGMYD